MSAQIDPRMRPDGDPSPRQVDVLFVDDERHMRAMGEQALALAGFNAESAETAIGLADRISPDWPGVLVTDVKLPGLSGLDLMREALEREPALPVILITGHGDIAMAVEAMRDGAYDFLEKPFPPERLVETVRRALEKRRLVLENRALRSALDGASALERSLLGRAQSMQRLRASIESYATTDADVLIIGETGAGKEVVARGLHEMSERSDGPFVAINCSALPETIVESELFGHEVGAFTGAQKARVGKFEYADGGTLFLDEIETMPLEMQARLLRVLQDRTIVRLGANKERPVDLRVIAATKTDLKSASDAGAFRADLYYRLDVLKLAIPPLRERREDIPLLFEHFSAQAAARTRRAPPAMSATDVSQLLAHDWPGNVRELENCAMRFALGLGVDLGGDIGARPGASQRLAGPGDGGALANQLAAVERAILAQALEENGGSMRRTYEQLGVSRKTLYDKLRRHGLNAPADASGDED